MNSTNWKAFLVTLAVSVLPVPNSQAQSEPKITGQDMISIYCVTKNKDGLSSLSGDIPDEYGKPQKGKGMLIEIATLSVSGERLSKTVTDGYIYTPRVQSLGKLNMASKEKVTGLKDFSERIHSDSCFRQRFAAPGLKAIRSAVCHRDYADSGNVVVKVFDDRLEVSNPGGLPASLTVEDLRKPHESRPRNTLIADAFFLIKYIKPFGTGTHRMIRQCQEAGMPEPKVGRNGRNGRNLAEMPCRRLPHGLRNGLPVTGTRGPPLQSVCSISAST